MTAPNIDGIADANAASPSGLVLPNQPWSPARGGMVGYALALSLAAHAGALLIANGRASAPRAARPAPLLLTMAPTRPEPVVAVPIEPKPQPPRREERHRHEPSQGTPVPAAAKAPTPPAPVRVAEPVPQRPVEAPVTPARAEAPAVTTAPTTLPSPAASTEGNVTTSRPVATDAATTGGAPAAATTVAAVSSPQRDAARPGGNGPADRIEPPHYGLAYLNNPQPQYPAAARRMRLEGTVLVRVRVSPNGTPEEVQLATSSGTPILDDAAMNAIRGWRFVPARRGDTPITHWAEVPVRFRLQE